MKKCLLLLLMVTMLTTACDDSGDDEKLSGLVSGEWMSAYDGVFFDTEKSMFYKGYDVNGDGTIDWQTESDTAGSIAEHSDYDDAEGYVVIKVTIDIYDSYGVDTYTVARWKECDGEKMKQSTAAKYTADFLPDGPQSYDSADEALDNLTEENGYFGIYADYTKKESERH